MTITRADASERYLRGAKTLAEMGGDIASIEGPLADIAPELARYVGEFAFGDLYHRPGLDLREKQLVTIASLTTLGDSERQLKFHTHVALTAGVAPQDIVNAVIHLLAFAGNPRVFNAMLAVRQVFDERELLPLAP